MVGAIFPIRIQELELIKDGFLYIRDMWLVGFEGVAFLVHVGLFQILSKVSFKFASMREPILLDSRTVVTELVPAKQVPALIAFSTALLACVLGKWCL